MDDASSGLQPEVIDSEQTFGEAVIAGVEQAHARRLLELTLCDPHFGFWPLSNARLLNAFTAFARLPGRRLVMLAQRYDHVARRHPRFVRWRTDWSHAVSPLCLDDRQLEMPGLLLAGTAHALVLRDPESWAGEWVTDRRRLQSLNEQAQFWRAHSQPDLPVSITGL